MPPPQDPPPTPDPAPSPSGSGHDQDAKPLRFEQAISQLESIIERIESGEIGLEESLDYYEKGTHLIRRCQDILDTTQQRIKELTADARGRLDEPDPPADADL